MSSENYDQFLFTLSQNYSHKFIIQDIDQILIMSVNPCFGDQKFIEHTYQKIEYTRVILKSGSQARIEVDGGVDLSNAAKLFELGADILGAGSSVFGFFHVFLIKIRSGGKNVNYRLDCINFLLKRRLTLKCDLKLRLQCLKIGGKQRLNFHR